MQTRSLSRELALLVLGQIAEKKSFKFEDMPIEDLLQRSLDTLMQHWSDTLDNSASELEKAHQYLDNSDLQAAQTSSIQSVCKDLRSSLMTAEKVLNGLSACLELPRLLILSDQEKIRHVAMRRVYLVVEKRQQIDSKLNEVMEGWRLNRLPRIDRDILRLAVVDISDLGTPVPVACNEAVELANLYSDDQGRRMINGVLRRFYNAVSSAQI